MSGNSTNSSSIPASSALEVSVEGCSLRDKVGNHNSAAGFSIAVRVCSDNSQLAPIWRATLAEIASFAQMARDAVLSRLSGTDPGKLDWNFFLRALSYGAVPLFALLASQFPSLGRSLFSWIQPALNAIQ